MITFNGKGRLNFSAIQYSLCDRSSDKLPAPHLVQEALFAFVHPRPSIKYSSAHRED